MIPLKDYNPTERAPVVTILLIAANIFVYFVIQHGQASLFTTATPNAEQQVRELRFTYHYAAVPDEVVDREPLTTEEVARSLNAPAPAVAAVASEICQRPEAGPNSECFPDKNVFLAMLFSMFLHGGLLHLGGNMLFLWVFGNNIEDRLGPVRYILFYLIAGFVAAAAHIGVQPNSLIPVIGASGAIAGVMGAYLIWFPDAPVRTLIIFFIILFRDIPAKWLLIAWFVLQFFTNPNEGVAWVAHVGGFVFGVLIALLVRNSKTARQTVWRSAYGDRPGSY
jgi:membrane associated rhomboid family serine protease